MQTKSLSPFFFLIKLREERNYLFLQKLSKASEARLRKESEEKVSGEWVWAHYSGRFNGYGFVGVVHESEHLFELNAQ
ncbi:hypothetical protein SCA6_005401 [Theobroma cacao]